MTSARTIRALIVDDEPLARERMRSLLGGETDVEVVGEAKDGVEAVETILGQSPDLVFLDVQMPKLDGFEVIQTVGAERMPAVVFVTAYDEFALRAFEVHAVDYLLKPFGRERLAEALVRVRERLAARPAGTPLPAAKDASAGALAAEARGPGHFVSRVIVRDGAEIHVIPVEQIDYLEAQDDYVAIHVGERSWLKQQPLSELERTLDPEQFVRVHRSYVLRLDRLARLEPYAKDSRVAVLADGREVPVSRGGYQRLREKMGG